MARQWEVRGLFGNEFAMDSAIAQIEKLKPAAYNVLDRRNLQVLMSPKDEETRELVKNIIRIAHGFVEGEAPLGEIAKRKRALKQKRLEELEEKRKRQQVKH